MNPLASTSPSSMDQWIHSKSIENFSRQGHILLYCFDFKFLKELNLDEGLDPRVCCVKEGRRRKNIIKKKTLAFSTRDPFLLFLFHNFFHYPCWSQLHMPNNKTTTIIGEWTKEGTHQEEAMMEGVELQCFTIMC